MKKIDAHAHIFERIASFGKCGELRPIGNGVCRWANGDEMAIIPKGYGDKEFMAETLLKIMDEEDVEKAILLQGSLYGFQNEYAMETAEKYPDRFVTHLGCFVPLFGRSVPIHAGSGSQNRESGSP